MRALRLLSQTKIRIPVIYFRRFAPLSSSPAATNPRFSNSFFDEAEGTSEVYRHTLKFQRPSSIVWRKQLWNSASFIGTVTQPLKVLDVEKGPFCAYTFLGVSSSNQSMSALRVLLEMRDEMGKLCLNHLKPDDFIYVSGPLGTYTKADLNGKLRLFYKVTVKKLNYVTQRCDSACQKNKELESNKGQTSFEKYKNRLHLWQVFFANPDEWWDNRRGKVNPLLPDFKHKDTGEALWLSPNDPPWIKKQLEKLDSTTEEQGLGERIGHQARVSKWEYDA
ncbi:Single-stranded DNA-binding protein [Trema orientale]|uniref:Single-stranded DNA-binding protein n=1 Tax=Trema orientale TaxID=63057 RepID=A0A2P5FN36_TREOI|nr:Single-stranded DNA-binding protein [Trema orientale]